MTEIFKFRPVILMIAILIVGVTSTFGSDKTGSDENPNQQGEKMLQVGDVAPDFSMQATDGSMVTLSKLKGKVVILYFYPKDNTPGCTKQACSIRDSWGEFTKRGWLVYGVSADSNKSHQKFTEGQSLPFPLLSDTDRTVQKAYGAFGKKKFMGREVEGTLRYTFVVGSDGKLIHIDRDVKVGTHASDLLTAIDSVLKR